MQIGAVPSSYRRHGLRTYLGLKLPNSEFPNSESPLPPSIIESKTRWSHQQIEPQVDTEVLPEVDTAVRSYFQLIIEPQARFYSHRGERRDGFILLPSSRMRDGFIPSHRLSLPSCCPLVPGCDRSSSSHPPRVPLPFSPRFISHSHFNSSSIPLSIRLPIPSSIGSSDSIFNRQLIGPTTRILILVPILIPILILLRYHSQFISRRSTLHLPLLFKVTSCIVRSIDRQISRSIRQSILLSMFILISTTTGRPPSIPISSISIQLSSICDTLDPLRIHFQFNSDSPHGSYHHRLHSLLPRFIWH